MTNTWSNEKIIDFINEIHQYPEVWNTSLYKDRNAKKDGWEEIAAKFNVTSNEAYKKFRSLRTYAKNEVKRLKSGSAVKWFAFDAISFILTQNTTNTGVDSENASNVTQNTDSDVSADPEETVESDITDFLEILDTTPKPRAKRFKTMDPQKPQNILCYAGEKKRNEYSAFGEHIANKLSKYDDYTRAQAELKISQILFECDMTMHRTRSVSTYTQTSHYNSDISSKLLQNDDQQIIVSETPNQ